MSVMYEWGVFESVGIGAQDDEDGGGMFFFTAGNDVFYLSCEKCV